MLNSFALGIYSEISLMLQFPDKIYSLGTLRALDSLYSVSAENPFFPLSISYKNFAEISARSDRISLDRFLS